MNKPVNEQVVVITGASSGIGRATALRFGQVGASVVLAARNGEALRQVAQEIERMGSRVHVVETDVADREQIERLAGEAVATFGRIDTWANIAAISIYATVEDTSIEEFERVMHVNYLSQVYAVKTVLPLMKQQGYGTIINVGSVESKRALPYQAAYAASKHAIKGFTEALRQELMREKQHDIHVTLIMPSGINTPLFDHARSKIGAKPRPVIPAYEPELVADTIVFAAAHPPQRDIYVGGAGWGFGLLQRISPGLLDKISVTGDLMFNMQKSDEPDNGRDNLDAPMSGPGRVRGDFEAITKETSLYTRLMETSPDWVRLLIPAALVGGVLALINRR